MIDLRPLALAVAITLGAIWWFAIATHVETSTERQKILTDEQSCYTGRPNNVVMCVDLGMGHHSLLQPR
jgi:hypothetical protein